MPPKTAPSSSNWAKLKEKLHNTVTKLHDEVASNGPMAVPKKKRKRLELNEAVHLQDRLNEKKKTKQAEVESALKFKEEYFSEEFKSRYVGLDCEMVGTGTNGKVSALARCAVVNFDGETIYDKFVRPKDFVTDFRTKWSGVRRKDLRQGEAIEFEQVLFLIPQKPSTLVSHIFLSGSVKEK